jgi:pimeloyl-ACP methyl ester carboxylesterase
MKPESRSKWLWAALVLLGAAWLAQTGWSKLGQAVGAQTVDFAPAVKTCAQRGAFRYCVYTPADASRFDADSTVYHLHGRNLDEHVWNDNTYFTALLQQQWQRSTRRLPRVVSVSYGGAWLLVPKGAQAPSGLLEDFMSQLDAIERETGRPKRRMLLGESMGGLNVLIAGLTHPERFAKVASLCPGVYAQSPFADFKTIWAALPNSGASPKAALNVALLARRYFANDAEYQRASPLWLIERATPQHPALYLSCGLYDHLGNFDGTRKLAARAQDLGVPVTWRPLYGGHCATDVPSVADFLLSD